MILLIHVLNQEDRLSFIFWNYFIWSNFIYALLLSSNLQNIWSTILESFTSLNCFLTILYFSFVTDLLCSSSKCVSKESLSSRISHTLATLKYSIPFFFVLRKVRYLFLYIYLYNIDEVTLIIKWAMTSYVCFF